jgi:hypothetical protein
MAETKGKGKGNGTGKGKRLTRRIVLDGIRYREDVDLPGYPGYCVTIRPLRDVEVMGLVSDMRGAAGRLDDLQKLAEDPDGKAKVAEALRADSDMMGLLKQVCELGIVADTEEEDLSSVFDEMVGFSIFIIGMRILELSHITDEGVDDFFGAVTETSSSPSTSEDGGSVGEGTPAT